MKVMKTNYIKALGIVALLAASTFVSAQEDNTVSRQMTLEREYDPSVQDANKVNTLPAVKEPEVQKRSIDYATYTIPTEPQRELGILPSGNIMTDMMYNKRRGYLNFGGGTYLNFNGDVGYHILSTDKNKLNIFFSHRSTNGNVKYFYDPYDGNKVKAKLNDNLGGINYRHFFEQGSFKIGAKYGYSAFNYYGMPSESPYPIQPTEESLLPDVKTNQVNQLIKANIGVESNEDTEVGYLLDLDYTNFSYKYGPSKSFDGIKEHSIGGKAGLSSAFGGNQRVGVAAKFDYFNYSLSTSHLNSSVPFFENYFEGTLTPYYKVEGDSWKLKLGVNAMFITGDNKKFFVSPDIATQVNIGSSVVFYLNADGQINSNSAYLLSRENRYIDPFTGVAPSRTWVDGLAGFRGYAGGGFWFNVFAGYKITDDDYFFVPTQSYVGFANYSSVLPLNSKRFQGGAELKYAYQKLFEITLKGVYNNWKVENGKSDDISDASQIDIDYQAYGRPEMELTAGIKVSPVEDFSVELNYNLQTGREALVGFRTNEKMKNINELNVTGTYTLNDTFGFYVKANNLLFQKYEYIYGYPLQKFNAMIGVNINF